MVSLVIQAGTRLAAKSTGEIMIIQARLPRFGDYPPWTLASSLGVLT